jgi:hypothetical protein
MSVKTQPTLTSQGQKQVNQGHVYPLFGAQIWERNSSQQILMLPKQQMALLQVLMIFLDSF